MIPDINVANVALSIVSFLAGAITQIGVYRYKGKRVPLPFISDSSRNFTVVAVVVGLLSVLTVFSVQSSAQKTAECNSQFREALAYNVMIGGEERDLNSQRDKLDTEYQKLLTATISEVVRATPDKAITPLIKLVDETNRINDDKANINVKLIQSNEQRKPYPSPTC